ncbi:hypothetical protein EWW49_26005 [Pseudomonas syringae]|nr:hypothetical protein EWW49_26005 [Pseudomonas syringae]
MLHTQGFIQRTSFELVTVGHCIAIDGVFQGLGKRAHQRPLLADQDDAILAKLFPYALAFFRSEVPAAQIILLATFLLHVQHELVDPGQKLGIHTFEALARYLEKHMPSASTGGHLIPDTQAY